MWAGNWTTVEIFEPSDEMPQGKKDKGAETMRPGPGGLSLIGDYESHGAHFGHMVVTWIPQEHAYKSFWTDLTQPGVSISTGKWEGDTLVFTSVDESTGKKLEARDTYSEITPNSFTDTLETGPLAGPMKKILTVKYTKQDNAATRKGPCDEAQTQAELNECFGQELHKADVRLNAIYKRLIAAMETELEKSRKGGDPKDVSYGEQQVKKLKAAELSWINYRDLHCAATRHQEEGGSISPMIWARCMTEVTNHRIDEIKDAYAYADRNLEPK